MRSRPLNLSIYSLVMKTKNKGRCQSHHKDGVENEAEGKRFNSDETECNLPILKVVEANPQLSERCRVMRGDKLHEDRWMDG